MMDLLKELFSDFEEDNRDSGDEFDFDLDGGDEELNFDDYSYEDGEGDEELDDLDGVGAEEDYPETMGDMPSMEQDDVEDEVEDIAQEIESLYKRLGRLAAAGDLNLYDDSLVGDEDDNEGFEDDPSMDREFEDDPSMDPEMPPMDDMGFDDEEDLPL
jgi:hypothetical protein